jgi:hypothetical protein
MYQASQYQAQNIPVTILIVNGVNVCVGLFNKINDVATQTISKLFVFAVFIVFMVFFYPLLRFLYLIGFAADSTPPTQYAVMRNRYDALTKLLSDDVTLFIRALKVSKQPFYLRPLFALLNKYYDRLTVQHQAMQTVIDELNKPMKTTFLVQITENELWKNRHPSYQYQD